ncbi:MAG: DNA repair helicase XPB [bacterium]
MNYHPDNPVIIQSDKTILLEVDNPAYEEARDELVRFAELEKSPEHIHTYKISPLSLWNAAAAGLTAVHILNALERFSKFDLPENVKKDICDYIARYGRLKLIKRQDGLFLYSNDEYLITEIWHNKLTKPYLLKKVDSFTIEIHPLMRGHVKQALIKIGFPVEDLAGYVPGTYLDVSLLMTTRAGRPFNLRHYQVEAVANFHAGGGLKGGSGVIVLPCGAGKTMVGLGAIERLKCETLILVTNIIALRQWISEIIDKTNLPPDMIGEYSGEVKEIRPLTLATYQILTYRRAKDEEFPHFSLVNRHNWGLIIYDEVHLLPAPVFRITAEIQAKRRLGLTATLVREDGLEEDVFSLIGPKKYDVPWKELEREGWIATAICFEIRINLEEGQRLPYAVADDREKFRISSENPAKIPLVKTLIDRHEGESILVIGQYLKQLKFLAMILDAPLITGQVSNLERTRLYQGFKEGKIKVLVVSKVANFAIDLPQASVAIQVSGTFGSRQEEAQRLGRILRPKREGTIAHFYSLVTRETKEQHFASNRQLFLTEQGYKYIILDGEELLSGEKGARVVRLADYVRRKKAAGSR